MYKNLLKFEILIFFVKKKLDKWPFIIGGVVLLILLLIWLLVYYNNFDDLERCGDGICDTFEENSNNCPLDCDEVEEGLVEWKTLPEVYDAYVGMEEE